MERVDHVHVAQVRRGRLIGQIHRVLERQVPDGERLELGVPRPDAPLVLVIELAEAGGHFPAAGAGGRHHHQRALRLDEVVSAQSLVADDVLHVGGVARDGIVPVAPHAQLLQPRPEALGGGLALPPGDDHAAHVKPQRAEAVDQPEDVLVVGNAQIAPQLVFLNVARGDGDHDLHVRGDLLEHAHLAVRREARQHPRRVIIVKQLAAELRDPAADLLRLEREIPLVVKSDLSHTRVSPPVLSHILILYFSTNRAV